MTMNYFTGATTAEDLKSMYRTLCKRLHPDNGGSSAEFIEMRRQFKRLWETMQDVHRKKDGTTYTASKDKRTWTADEFMSFVDWLTHTLRVDVNITGTFYRITGIGKEEKDRQRALKDYVRDKLPTQIVVWDGMKVQWIVRPKDWQKKTGKVWKMETIEEAFGSTKYKAKENTDMVAM